MSLEELPRELLLAQLKELERKRLGTESLVHDLQVHHVELELQNRELREAQAAVEQSRSRFQELYDFAPVAYYTFDPRGCVQEVNLTGATMVGRERAGLLGLPFLALVKLEEPGAFWSHLRRCNEQRQAVMTELRFWTEHRGTVDVQAVSVPVLDAQGQVAAFRTSFADISERKRVESALAQSRAEELRLHRRFEALDRASVRLTQVLAAPDAEPAISAVLQVFVDEARDIGDAEFAVLCTPGAGAETWTFSADDAAQRALARGAASTWTGLAGLVREGQSLRLADLRQRPGFQGLLSGGPELRSLLAVPMRASGRLLGTLLLANKRPAAEFTDEDQRVIEMLAVRAALALQAARLGEDVRAAVRAREELLAVVTHDLRGPLQAISLSANALAQRPGDGERRKGRKQVELIQRATGRLERLTNDLLLASNIEARTLSIVPSVEDAAALLDEAALVLEPLAVQREVALKVRADQPLPPVWCDRHRVLQVLENVVGNALKFAPPQSAIELSASAEGGALRVVVSDAGPGIAPEQLHHLFDRYWQGKGSARRGVGLGLYIARGIIEAHGGQISVRSALGEGTAVTLTLPLRPPSAPPDAGAAG